MTQSTAVKRSIKHPVTAPKPTTGHTIASVPDFEIFSSYIGRTVSGATTDFEMLTTALNNKLNVLIGGPTGPGKTMVTEAFAALHNMPHATIACSVGVDVPGMFGKYIPNESRKSELDPEWIWQDGPVTDIWRHGGLLLIDEINFMPERVATILYPALDRRRVVKLIDHKGETIHAHPNLLIVATMNPDYAGTRQLNAAFRNRFQLQLTWDYDPLVESQLVTGKAIRDIAEKLRADTGLKHGTPVATNMMIEFEKLVKLLGLEFAVNNFCEHFTTDEQPEVRKVFMTYEENLANDYRSDAEIDDDNDGFAFRRSSDPWLDGDDD